MRLRREARKPREGQSIFRSLFVPLLIVMCIQAAIFYLAAVYGGVEETLSQNAVDILSERLANRKNEIETRFGNKWSVLSQCAAQIDEIYLSLEAKYGDKPLVADPARQIMLLADSAEPLIAMLRRNEVNGVFLIINDQATKTDFADAERKYGLCIRDMDQESNYIDREDLLLERAPSSLVDSLGCALDSWWEALYTFSTREEGIYYYAPLDAAWDNKKASGAQLAYFSSDHHVSESDPEVISYSIPLIAKNGYPYAVLGVELSTRYIASLLPNSELGDSDKCCYVLSMMDAESGQCIPICGSGALYNRCFSALSAISTQHTDARGGFLVTSSGGVELYGEYSELHAYANNSPFEGVRPVLIAFVEKDFLFGYVNRVKSTLLIIAMCCLVIGVVSILLVSRRFAAPITDLAKRVRNMKSVPDYKLARLGITQIDQLVDAIEELNRNVSRSSARTEFFSRMSHDMRTPMNAIIGFSSPELLDGATEEVKTEYLKKIHSSGEYLLELINEVLDMTKIESNKTDLHTESFKADLLLDSTISIIEKLANQKGVEFAHEIHAIPGIYVDADKQHINQIVMNLLSNAVKFTPKNGKVSLNAEFEVTDEPNMLNLLINVTDTGIGMSDEFLAKLYTPFEQENSVREGTGLGLSISKKLTELMNGSIHCKSVKGKGTTFTVSIPLQKSELSTDEKDQSELLSDDLDYSVLEGRKILVCEDNSINAQIVCHLLSRKGASFKVASDGLKGAEAFEKSAPGEYDAILMDIRMPVLDGIGAARKIRAMNRKDAKTVPILALTANAFEEDARQSSDAGMNAHLAKPIESLKFYQTLINLIKN